LGELGLSSDLVAVEVEVDGASCRPRGRQSRGQVPGSGV